MTFPRMSRIGVLLPGTGIVSRYAPRRCSTSLTGLALDEREYKAD